MSFFELSNSMLSMNYKSNSIFYKVDFVRVFPNQSNAFEMRKKFLTYASRGNSDKITMLWKIVAFVEALFFCIWQVFCFLLFEANVMERTRTNEEQQATKFVVLLYYYEYPLFLWLLMVSYLLHCLLRCQWQCKLKRPNN